MSFKNQSVFSSVYTNTTFTITEDMQLSEVVIELQSGSATLLGGLQVPGLTLSSVALTVGQPVVLNSDSGYTLTGITIDSTAGGVFEVYGTYQYNDGVDASAAAYFTATGITGATQQAAIDNLVKSLKGYGLWSKMKAIYPFVTDNYNLLSYTEDFTFWTKIQTSVNANTAIAPDGTLTADSIIPNTTSTSHYVGYTTSFVGIGTFTFYAKAAGYNYVTLANTPNNYIHFDLTNGNISTLGTGWGSASCINIGDGWFRCQATNSTSQTWGSVYMYSLNTWIPSGNNPPAFAGNGTSGTLLWGAQLVEGTNALDYQPILTTQQAYISAQFKYNLKDPRDLDAAFRLVFNGGWTFSNSGALPNGTNGYADTKLNSASILSLNSTHLSYYSRSDVNSQSVDIGNYNGVNSGTHLFLRYLGNLYVRINDEDATSIIRNNSLGYVIGSRISSTIKSAYVNNIKTSLNINSVSLTNNNIVLGALNDISTGIRFFSTRQTAFATIGDGLTDTEASNLYIAVQTYQEALSRQVGVPVVSDPNAQAFIDAAQITDVTQADAINNLVLGLKYDNLWNKMTAIYPFVGGTATTHKYNLKDPRDLDAAYRLVFNGGWTHSSTGATPNGTNGYANTYLVPSSVLTLNSTHISTYLRTNISGLTCDISVIQDSATTQLNIYPRYLDEVYFRVFDNSLATATNLNSQGLYVANRISSIETRNFKNNTLLIKTESSGTINTSRIIIGAGGNALGVPSAFSTRQTAFATIGSGLTDADASNLYNRVQTYQTALSRQVS